MKMVRGLTTLMRKVNRILKNGLFTGNSQITAQVGPKCLKLRAFLSQSSIFPNVSKYPPQEFEKPNFSRLNNSSFSSSGGEGGGGNKKDSIGGRDPGGKTKVRILINMSTAGILGVCWVQFKKTYGEFNWKDCLNNFLGRGTAKNTETKMDMKKESDVTLRDWIPCLIIFCSYTYI